MPKSEGFTRQEGDAALRKLNAAHDKRVKVLAENEWIEKELAGKNWFEKLLKMGVRFPYLMADDRRRLKASENDLERAQKEYDTVVGSAKEEALVLQKNLEKLGRKIAEICSLNNFANYFDMASNYRSDSLNARASRPASQKRNGEEWAETERIFLQILGKAANLNETEEMKVALGKTNLSIAKLPDGSFSVIQG